MFERSGHQFYIDIVIAYKKSKKSISIEDWQIEVLRKLPDWFVYSDKTTYGARPGLIIVTEIQDITGNTDNYDKFLESNVDYYKDPDYIFGISMRPVDIPNLPIISIPVYPNFAEMFKAMDRIYAVLEEHNARTDEEKVRVINNHFMVKDFGNGYVLVEKTHE